MSKGNLAGNFFFFPFFSLSFFPISVPYKYLCTDIISINYIRRVYVTFFGNYLFTEKSRLIKKIYVEDNEIDELYLYILYDISV